MTRALTTLFATAAVLGGLAAAPLALAEEGTSAPPQPHGQGMMGGHGGMTMAPMSPDQMRQMSEMVSNCNRMMESMNGPPTGPGAKDSSDPRG